MIWNKKTFVWSIKISPLHQAELFNHDTGRGSVNLPKDTALERVIGVKLEI